MWGNSRPIAAPICATFFAGPSRSSRDISEACRLAGTATTRRRFLCDSPLRFTLTLRIQHRLGHLLDEQWNAVGALDDVLADARRQRPVADDSLDEEIDVAPRQPIEGQRSHVRPSDPGRAEFRPESNKYQEPVAHGQVHHPGEQFEAGWIGPMRIFENHQHGIDPRQRLDLRTKRFQRFLTTELRLNFNRRVASIVGQRQHFGKQRRILAATSSFAPAARQACPFSLAGCHREQSQRRASSGR